MFGRVMYTVLQKKIGSESAILETVLIAEHKLLVCPCRMVVGHILKAVRGYLQLNIHVFSAARE